MVVTRWERRWDEAEESKGSQIYADGGRLDYGWGTYNGVYRCSILKLYS